MSDDFLSRWSRLKRTSTQAPGAEAARGPVPARAQPAPAPAALAASAPAPAPPPLPAVESLSFESDFTAFMKPEVGEVLKRQALKTLFQDPRFNVMDGLDVYIADYSLADPLPEGWLEKMTQTVRLGEYKAPEEEVPRPAAEAAQGVPAQAAEVVQKEPQNEVLATPAQAVPADTLEAPAMPPPVPQSPSR